MPKSEATNAFQRSTAALPVFRWCVLLFFFFALGLTTTLGAAPQRQQAPGREIIASSNTQRHTNATRRYAPAVRQPARNGKPIVRRNASGATAMSSASLLLDVKPLIVLQPLPGITFTGGTASFTVLATGIPAPTYQWHHNSVPIPGATSATVSIKDVQKSDQGRYSVRVQNSAGAVDSIEVGLTILDLPSILGQPRDVSVGASPAGTATATFSVEATGDALSYQWFRSRNDGAPELITGANLPTLTIAGVTLADAGLYWVEISNLLGTVTSAAAELSILGILVQPLDVLAAIGDTLNLTVEAVGRDLQYQWTRNGEAVPGATNATLTITNGQPQDGGRYAVLVFNPEGAVRSVDAIVRVITPELPFTDHFEQRGAIGGLVGVGSANNTAATPQPDDPAIAGAAYYHSMWVSWTAPAHGPVTMATLGSDFDTVLSVYQGNALNELALVAWDDESGGFHNSKLTFNAVAGATYQIRVDSFQRGAGGNIVFAWTLLPTGCLLPLDIAPAGDFVTLPGEPLNLFVSYNNTQPCGLNLQWHLDGLPLAQKTNEWLQIPSVTPDTVGRYALRMNTAEWDYWVQRSEVQINTEGAKALAHSRLEDARRTALLGVAVTDTRVTGAAAKFTPLASGYSGSQVFRTYPGKDPNEPHACGVQGGASYWFVYSPPESGLLRLSTEGSNFDTVLAVYIDDGRNLGYQSLIALGCDNNSGSNGLTSVMMLPVSQGTNYYIMVDGVNGASGRVHLNYLLDTLPKISAIPNQTIQENSATAWLPFTVRDTETPVAQLTVQASCADTNLVAASGFAFSGSGSNRLVRITPNTNVFGTNMITVSVMDGVGGMQSTQFLLNVVHVAQPLQISGTLPYAIAGSPYSAQVTVSGGAAPYTCSLTNPAPDGLSFNTNGVLSGTPATAGTNVVAVRVVDSVGATTNKLVSLVVLPPIRLTATLSGTNTAFQIIGRPDTAYVLEMTEQIASAVWIPIATNSSPSGLVTFPMPPATAPTCFFRTREQ